MTYLDLKPSTKWTEDSNFMAVLYPRLIWLRPELHSVCVPQAWQDTVASQISIPQDAPVLAGGEQGAQVLVSLRSLILYSSA